MLLHYIINILILKQMKQPGVHKFDASGLSNQNSVKTDGSSEYFMALKKSSYILMGSKQGILHNSLLSMTEFYQVYVRARLCAMSEELWQSCSSVDIIFYALSMQSHWAPAWLLDDLRSIVTTLITFWFQKKAIWLCKSGKWKTKPKAPSPQVELFKYPNTNHVARV